MKMKTSNATSDNEQDKTIIFSLWQNYHSTVKCRKTAADLQTTGENLQEKGSLNSEQHLDTQEDRRMTETSILPSS